MEATLEHIAIAESWARLKTHLAAMARELNAEVHSYPTPIARCDDQLPKLLEQRGRAVLQLQLANALGETPGRGADAEWRRKVGEFLARPDGATDDDIEASIRARLRAALSALPRSD
jgi:hypothetical protein